MVQYKNSIQFKKMGNKYSKIDRFKSVIPAKYLPEEILKINEISLKSYFAEQVNLEFADIWSLRAQSKPENFDAILQALKNKELLNFFKSFFKSFRKSWAYYFLPGWVFLGWFRIFRNQELLILVRQKYDLAVYFHRLRVNKKLRSIQVDRGVILTFFIFAFSAIQYIFARFKPLINPYILVNNLPLFCYPIETIKWESLMSSEIAQRILVEEDNKIDLFDDYLLIRRNKELNLFGHIYLKDSDDKEFWIWEPKEKKKLSQIFYDLDELPKYLESSYAPTEEKPDLSDAELKEFLDSNTSLEFKELFNKKALTSKRQTEINQIIRDQYALSIGHLNFTSILHRANEKNLNLFKDRAEYIKKYGNEELEENVRIKEFYSLIPDKELEPYILKYPRTAFQKLQVDQNLEDLNTLDKKWGTSKNFRNKKSLNKNNSIISIRNNEFFKKYNKKNISSTSLKDKKEINETIVNINSNDSKETEALNNQPSSSFDQINIDLSFIKNPKLYSKLDNLFKNNKELFINVVDHFYNFKSRNKNSKVYIKPRKMSGYRYPDLNSKEIKLLLLKDFLFQNKETDIVQIELPPDLVFTNSFLLNYPKAPDAKNLKIASAKPLKTIKYESLENLPDADLDELEDPNDPDNLAILKDSKYDVSLANNLETKYLVDHDPDDDENQQEQEQEDEAEEYDPGTLEVNYKGPAALVNESNDIRVLYDAKNKNVKPYLSRSKDSRLIINVPFSYFTGSMNIDSLKKSLRKPDNKESIPEINLETKDLENTENKNTINNEGIATENSKNHIKDEYTIPEENALRPWLLNYYSPDNPLTSTDVAFSDDTFEKLNRKKIRKAKKADPTLLEAFYDEEIDLKISKRAIYSDKKWKFFPYAEEIDDEEESDYIPLIPSKKNVILIGINSEGWQSRQPIEEDFLPFLDEIASNTELEDEETVTMSGLEVHHYTNELMGYAIAELPTADIFVPEPKEIPNLEFGLVNEIDYSPLVRALFRKITTFHFDLYTRRVLNDTFGNHLVSNKRQRFKTRSTRKHRNKRKRKGKTTNIITRYLRKPWEPLTANSWLVISQFWFAYICCIIFKETAFNYGREFVSFILELISQGGFIPPMVIDELKILIGEKDPGFRIARDFTKGFRDLVGIDNLGNKLLDTLLFLRGAISNPLIAKNAQSLLLVGPPGTGKTLLVHALAHEAKVPVLTLSAQGSQEPASLERCFQEARRLAPCIVFLDEIDSMAQKRSLIIGEGDFYDNANNEEAGRRSSNYSMESEMSTVVGDLDPRLLQNKEALHMVVNRDVQNYLIDKNDREYYRIGMLSKLLTELDGVETTDGVVIIGATNRVEVLDPALLRPGRFYKHVHIGLPNKIKRMQLFNFYSDILGSDPTIPWDYLVNLTYGFSAADIATIMNESSIRAIANASLHTLETIEYGIDRITTINIDKPSSNKINNTKKEFSFSFSTVRSAYYQAGKALLGTLLKYHPPIRVVHLWYRENSVRYNQILKTIQLEWLNYVFRGELEHRIIGAYGGKVGEFFFLQYQDEAIDELNISTMGSQDWVIGQNLIRLLVDKWHLYAQNTLFQEQPAIKTHFNDEEFNDVREQYLYEFSQIYENTPTATNLMGFHADKNPQTRYPLSWWQMKIYEQYLLDELQKWFSVWLDDPEEWKLNIHWVPPDRTFHQNPFLEKITEIIKVDDFTSLVNDYQIHSIVMEAFNLGVVILDEYRELLDELVYELLDEEILREHTIYEICTNFGIDCDNLKEDLYNSEIKIEPLPQFKILYPSWGVDSAKPTIRWIDIAAITGETPDYGPEKSNEDLDESLASDEKINKDLEKSNITIDDAVESMKKEITDIDDVTTETSSENINKNLEEAGASENENEEANTDEDEKEEKKQIHILSTFYPNIIKENNYIFPKKEIEPPLDSSSNEENQ